MSNTKKETSEVKTKKVTKFDKISARGVDIVIIDGNPSIKSLASLNEKTFRLFQLLVTMQVNTDRFFDEIIASLAKKSRIENRGKDSSAEFYNWRDIVQPSDIRSACLYLMACNIAFFDVYYNGKVLHIKRVEKSASVGTLTAPMKTETKYTDTEGIEHTEKKTVMKRIRPSASYLSALADVLACESFTVYQAMQAASIEAGTDILSDGIDFTVAETKKRTA